MKNQEDRVIKAIIYCLFAHLMFAAMGTCAKYLANHYHVAEIAFYRNSIIFIPFFLFIIIGQKYHLLKTNRPKLVGCRAILGGASVIITFSALAELPMSYATVLFFTSTLLTPALAFFFLKEHVGIHRWGAVLVGMCGVLIIAQPSGEISLSGLFLALLAAGMHGIMYTTLRGLKTESPFTVTFYFILAGVFIPACFMPWVAKGIADEHIFIFMLTGAAAGIGQICLASAYKYAPASFVTPFAYTALLWTILIDLHLWGYSLDFYYLLAGAGLIIGAQIYIIYREYVNAQRARGKDDTPEDKSS
ncbi:MAG: DMT family transporter [Alphaproteobacteria bacterium]